VDTTLPPGTEMLESAMAARQMPLPSRTNFAPMLNGACAGSH
jgi:hypothetical protein